jgi:hypothetical protein
MARIAVNARFLLPDKMEGFGWFTHEVVKRMCLNIPNMNSTFSLIGRTTKNLFMPITLNPWC